MAEPAPKFAAKSNVPPDKTRQDIEKLLRKYGSDQVALATDDAGGRVAIMFRLRGRTIRFTDRLPQRADARSAAAHEQAVRTRWRAILLWIRCQLEWWAETNRPVEDVFFADLLLPDKTTVRERVGPEMMRSIEDGRMPTRIPYFGDEP